LKVKCGVATLSSARHTVNLIRQFRYLTGLKRQLIVTVACPMALLPCELAVTITVYCPAGVPGFVGGEPVPEPPPHAAHITSAVAETSANRFRLGRMKGAASRGSSQYQLPPAWLNAAVPTDSDSVFPFDATEQVAPVGQPLMVKVGDPAKPRLRLKENACPADPDCALGVTVMSD
jgi:hypothetical protein